MVHEWFVTYWGFLGFGKNFKTLPVFVLGECFEFKPPPSGGEGGGQAGLASADHGRNLIPQWPPDQNNSLFIGHLELVLQFLCSLPQPNEE